MLAQLKETLACTLPKAQEFKSEDWFLLKWLNEYHWDVQLASKAFRKAEKWREENQMDSILSEDFSDFREKFPYDNDGVTKDGLPILLVKFGKWNIREAVENGEKDQFLRYAYQMTDRSVDTLKKIVHKTKGSVTQVIIIFDLKGYSFRQLMHRQTISTLSEWTRRSEELHPQQLKSFYVINAPKIMPILFGLLKPFMSTNTVSRVSIFGSNEVVWRKVLLEDISTDQLIEGYGGTRKMSC